MDLKFVRTFCIEQTVHSYCAYAFYSYTKSISLAVRILSLVISRGPSFSWAVRGKFVFLSFLLPNFPINRILIMVFGVASAQDGAPKNEMHVQSAGTMAETGSFTVHEEHSPASLTKNGESKVAWLTFLIGDIHTDDDPMNLSNTRKQMIIFVVALSGISGPLGRCSLK